MIDFYQISNGADNKNQINGETIKGEDSPEISYNDEF